MIKKTAAALLVAIFFGVGFASPFFSFADTDGAEGDATVSVPAIASPDGDAKNGDEPDKKKDKKYKPGAAARSDIWLLVKAGILTRDIYGKSFERSIDAYELNGVLLSLHRFMGGSWFDEPASVEDESVIDAEGNPVWAVERGAAAASLAVTAINSKSYLWADTREIFFGFLAENSVADESKAGAAVETATGAAIEVTTGATTEVTTGAPLDTVTDALSDDTVGAPSDAVTDADVDTPTGASVEATTDATVGVATGASHYAATDYTMDTPAGAAVDTTTDASISAEPAPKRGITREDMFMLISRMVWEFDRENMEGIAPIPDTPAVQGASGEEFYRNDVYLYWEPVKYAETYIVKIYDDSENMLKSIRVGKPALNITEDSEPSFRAVFGEDGEGRRAYYTVQAVSAHGIRSEKTEPMGFTALNFDSARERYGKDYLKYEDGEEGKKHQTTVTLRVWRDVGGEKIPATINLSVHKKIAADVKRIFGEYFSGEEQFPIQSIGGFSIREKRSEHNYGTAIDINPNENYMVGPGGAESGAFWDPGESDYSIPKGSELVRAFERHGWYWAGDGWGETYDYMHFSFMGS